MPNPMVSLVMGDPSRRRLNQGAQSHKRRIGDFLESPANNLPGFPYKGHHIRYRCHGSKFDQICPKRTFGMKMLPQGLTELKSHPHSRRCPFLGMNHQADWDLRPYRPAEAPAGPDGGPL